MIQPFTRSLGSTVGGFNPLQKCSGGCTGPGRLLPGGTPPLDVHGRPVEGRCYKPASRPGKGLDRATRTTRPRTRGLLQARESGEDGRCRARRTRPGLSCGPVDTEHFEAPTTYTVEQAAEILQLTPGRVRQLLRDEHLDGTPPDAGSGQRGWSVDAESVRDRLARQQPRPEQTTAGDRGELVDELRRQNEYLRGQLDQERQAHAEARRIIGGLVQRVPALEASADPEQPRESRESAGDEPAKGPVPPDRETATETRPWWRRVFGG